MNHVLAYIAILLLTNSVPCHADSFTYQLDEKYYGAAPGGGNGPWLTATFEDVGTNEVKLTMAANGLDRDIYVSTWYFNTSYLSLISPLFDKIASTGPEGAVNGTASNADGAANFTFNFSFPFTGNLFDRSDSVIYYLYGAGEPLTASAFNLTNEGGEGVFYSAALLIKNDKVESWIGAGSAAVPVPEPATMLLLGLGLVLMAFWGRRIMIR